MQIDIFKDRPVLIAGPTASGKSALALHIAQTQGGTIINADALQVFGCWKALSARPSDADLAKAPHALYGHIAYDAPYSVGDWLKEVKTLISKDRPIIVGGTGLYLSALTEGLADIPKTPDSVRETANVMSLNDLLEGLDDATKTRIDVKNRVRVQRAWEVFYNTGRTILDWQNATPAPLMPLDLVTPIVMDAPKEWLTPRIARRFDIMLEQGALAETQAMLGDWDPNRLSSKAIGAPELIAHLKGEMTLDSAKEAAIISTRQYAKRQRTWFRKRMQKWHHFPASSTDLSTTFTFQT